MVDPRRGLNRQVDVPKENAARGQRREMVELGCEIGGRLGGAWGEVLDLTEGGVRIRSPHNYSKGDRMAVTLLIPGISQRFDFVVEIRWVEVAGSTDAYDLGCSFVHSDETLSLAKMLRKEFLSGNLPQIRRKHRGK